MVATLPIKTSRLDNGLLLTLSPDRTAPIVAVNLWYPVGSANDGKGEPFCAPVRAHAFSSEHVAANEHFELIQRAGGTLRSPPGSIERTTSKPFRHSNSNSLCGSKPIEWDACCRR
jgi:predicted Zn-dependent peptidase